MQNFFRPDKGFRFRACATSRTVVSAIFWFYQSPTAKTPPRTSTQNTSNDAFYARMCLLGVAKPKFKTYTPCLPQNRHFGARYGRYLQIIGRKPALTLEMLRVSGP